MSKITQEKAHFVENELAALVHAVDDRYVRLTYHEKGYEEFVYVEGRDGFFRKICITADSLFAIAAAVIEELK